MSKEYWIQQGEYNGEAYVTPDKGPFYSTVIDKHPEEYDKDMDLSHLIHVIEYSEYEDLKEDVEVQKAVAVALQRRIADLEEALDEIRGSTEDVWVKDFIDKFLDGGKGK